jgi:hypothetical protein
VTHDVQEYGETKGEVVGGKRVYKSGYDRKYPEITQHLDVRMFFHEEAIDKDWTGRIGEYPI